MIFRKKTAFTLIELLLVLAIIGVLAALLIPAIQAARRASQMNRPSQGSSDPAEKPKFVIRETEIDGSVNRNLGRVYGFTEVAYENNGTRYLYLRHYDGNNQSMTLVRTEPVIPR